MFERIELCHVISGNISTPVDNSTTSVANGGVKKDGGDNASDTWERLDMKYLVNTDNQNHIGKLLEMNPPMFVKSGLKYSGKKTPALQDVLSLIVKSKSLFVYPKLHNSTLLYDAKDRAVIGGFRKCKSIHKVYGKEDDTTNQNAAEESSANSSAINMAAASIMTGSVNGTSGIVNLDGNDDDCMRGGSFESNIQGGGDNNQDGEDFAEQYVKVSSKFNLNTKSLVVKTKDSIKLAISGNKFIRGLIAQLTKELMNNFQTSRASSVPKFIEEVTNQITTWSSSLTCVQMSCIPKLSPVNLIISSMLYGNLMSWFGIGGQTVNEIKNKMKTNNASFAKNRQVY